MMKKPIYIICSFFILIFWLSCKKENCIRCKMEGSWNVKETLSYYYDDSLVNETDYNFVAKFFEDGTGLYYDGDFFWTISPDNSKVFVSQTIEQDSLYRSYLFNVLISKCSQQKWEEVHLFNENTYIRTNKTVWELTK
jgi:hypothetical protein